MNTSPLISLHGGHSGQFCCHARDRLEDIVLAYIGLGFDRVGITEHAPPSCDQWMYPDEKQCGFTTADLYRRFEDYFSTLRNLQKKYASRITLYAGMETETFPGYETYIPDLIRRFRPDYIVGSVHHVDDICFDYSPADYALAVQRFGSHEALYERYFDLQQEMIRCLKPFVVGHFDLIRIHDPDYVQRLRQPVIRQKIRRNLELIQSLGLVLDFNLRPLARGEAEPYVSISAGILEEARRMGITAVPGDDSHGVSEAGKHVEKALRLLTRAGLPTRWPDPVLFDPDSDDVGMKGQT